MWPLRSPDVNPCNIRRVHKFTKRFVVSVCPSSYLYVRPSVCLSIRPSLSLRSEKFGFRRTSLYEIFVGVFKKTLSRKVQRTSEQKADSLHECLSKLMIRFDEFFSGSETFLINVVEKIRTYISCQTYFPPKSSVSGDN